MITKNTQTLKTAANKVSVQSMEKNTMQTSMLIYSSYNPMGE